MAKLRVQDFEHDELSGEWQCYLSRESGETIQISIAPDLTSEIINVAAQLFENVDVVKQLLTASSKSSVQREIKEAFRSAGLPVAIKNMQVWSIGGFAKHESTYSASVYIKISDKTMDPRKESTNAPSLLISIKLGDALSAIEIIDVERLVDMED